MNPQDSGSGPPSPALKLPPVIGHRGAAARAPENTLAGLRRAKALGCAWVEFDVRLTADGALVLCHDARLDRTTDRHRAGGGPQPCDESGNAMPEAGSVRPSPASAVPTLEEALALAAELGLGANVEIKADRGRGVRDRRRRSPTSLNRLGRGDCRLLLVSSFLPAVLAGVARPGAARSRAACCSAPCRAAGRQSRGGSAASLIGADHRRLRPRRVAEIRAAGYPVAGLHRQRPGARASVVRLGRDFGFLGHARYDVAGRRGRWFDIGQRCRRRRPAARAHQGALREAAQSDSSFPGARCCRSSKAARASRSRTARVRAPGPPRAGSAPSPASTPTATTKPAS